MLSQKARSSSLASNQIMLKCGDHYASAANCLSVLCSDKGGVDDNYVHVVAVLYTRIWQDQFKRSIRYMMDPTIAIRLLQEAANHGEWKATLRLVREAGSSYVGTSANQFYVVFVPVLEMKHWWCVAYCVHEQEHPYNTLTAA